jgi:hypothetical protein
MNHTTKIKYVDIDEMLIPNVIYRIGEYQIIIFNDEENLVKCNKTEKIEW